MTTPLYLRDLTTERQIEHIREINKSKRKDLKTALAKEKDIEVGQIHTNIKDYKVVE